MKKAILISIVGILMMFAPLFIQAQNPPHPNGGSSPGSGNTPVGGGAPVDGGITLLLAMSAGYGLRKMYKKNNFLHLQ